MKSNGLSESCNKISFLIYSVPSGQPNPLLQLLSSHVVGIEYEVNKVASIVSARQVLQEQALEKGHYETQWDQRRKVIPSYKAKHIYI